MFQILVPQLPNPQVILAPQLPNPQVTSLNAEPADTSMEGNLMMKWSYLSDYEMVESDMENDDADSIHYGAMLLEIVVAEQDTKIEMQEAELVALQKRMEGANINSEDKVSTCETPWYQKRRCELYKHDLACRSGMSLSLNQVLFLLFLP